MKKKNKRFPIAGFLIIFALAYMLFAAKQPKNAIQLVPEWTIDITQQSLTSSGLNTKPFKLGNRMGYYTSSGLLSFVQSIEQKGVISSDYMAVFSPDVQEVEVLGPDGLKKSLISDVGFPYFDDERIFLFAPTGNSFSMYNENGDVVWSYENYAPITSFYSNSKGVIVGYADGNITAFSLEGDIVQDYYPGGSEYEIIFASTMSESGRYTACLSGVDAQRIVVSDIEGNTNKVVFHKYVENPVFEQSLIQFSSNDQYVFVNENNVLTVVDVKKGTAKTISLIGKIITIKEINNGEYFFVLSKGREENTVTIFNNNMYQVGEFDFAGQNAFLDSDVDSIYIGFDTKISKIYIDNEQ